MDNLVSADDTQFPVTYISGFQFKTDKPVTKHRIYDLCIKLNILFGEGYSFEPEKISEGGILMSKWPKISEGGILMSKWPNKRKNEYKTMRIFCRNNYAYQWPWINDDDDPLISWQNNSDIIVAPLRMGQKLIYLDFGTVLKAFYGAPCWTISELKLMSEGLNYCGFCVLPGTFPSSKNLVTNNT